MAHYNMTRLSFLIILTILTFYSVFGQDSIIDFWDATLTCRLKVKKDTLIVERLENLPIGKNFVFQEAVWTIEKIYFNGQNIIRRILVKLQIPKYNNSEIQTVLKAFETAQPSIDSKTMEIANKLFIATISGSKTARLYFLTFMTPNLSPIVNFVKPGFAKIAPLVPSIGMVSCTPEQFIG